MSAGFGVNFPRWRSWQCADNAVRTTGSGYAVSAWKNSAFAGPLIVLFAPDPIKS
jgi:hypothetical protein